MKHKRFEENILVDEAYTNYGVEDKNADHKKSSGIAKNFAESLEYGEKKKWYHQMPEEPSTITKILPQDKIEEMRKEASSALHGDTLAYETKSNKNGSSDHQWARTLLNKGAIGDRVAAATILIQDNPIYNMTALRNLVNNVKPAKKKDGLVIIDALSELLITELLIPDVKLRTFEQHPLGHLDEMTSGNKQARRSVLKLWYYEDQLKELYGTIPDVKLRTFEQHPLGHLDEMTSGNKQARRGALKLWYYEDQLKELYGTYVEALNKFAHDSVEANKEKAVSAMSYLLMHHPEREKMLLTSIINKLGDPSQAVASKVIYHLCQLLCNHPNMKAVVLADIEKMLFRTNISARAQYYGICFLNQFFLGKDDARIAENLIRIYFSFFKASIKKGDIDSRLMSAILTGVKRAYPFADKARLAETPAHIDAIHKLVHLATINIAIHALALLFHISDASKGTSDRYYVALYRKLTSPDIFNTSHSALLFSLVYKSLKRDENVPRVTAIIKRMLQLCCQMTPAQACGMLFLVSQVLRDSAKKDAVRLVWSAREIKEEVKDEQPQITDETVTEVDDTENVEDDRIEEKKVDLLRGDKKDLLMDDDEDETYVDLKIDDQGNIKPKRRRPAAAATGWFHARVKSETKDQEGREEKEIVAKIQLKKTINMERVITEYNPWARNPAFAGADCTAYMELLPLLRHFHPTVKLFAEKLVHEQIIQYSGDPLKDFAGIRFLDRFVFKNPKKREEEGRGDIKRVKGSHPKFAVRKNYAAKGIKSLPVNSASYLNEDASKIPVDERFLYDFLQKRRHAQDDSDSDSDADSVTSEDFEKYLDSVTGTRADADSDDELDFLADMESTKQKRPAKKGDDSDDQLGSDDDDDGDSEGDDDGELNISGDEDEPVLSGEEDELLLENSDDDDEIGVPGEKSKKGKMKLKLKGKDDLGSLFASAEEFSTLLEETATNKKQGSSQAVANTDNSSAKQLAWEDKRDHWMKGYNRKVHGAKNKKFKNKQNGRPSKMAEKGGKRKTDSSGGAGGKKRKFK